MTSSSPPSTVLKPVVPLLDVLLRIREDMKSRPSGPYRYIGHPDVDYVHCFKGGYAECLHVLGVQSGSDALFGPWLRDIKQAWPLDGWEAAYLRECEGDQTRAVRKYLDHIAEFRTLSPEILASLPWIVPEDARLATRSPQLMPLRAPTPLLDFLLEIRREIGDTLGRLFLFIGPIEVRRMEAFIAGYRLCMALVGARDEEYVRFERWLHDEKGLPAGQEWPQPFLAACQSDPELAIRRLLEFAAEFRGV